MLDIKYSQNLYTNKEKLKETIKLSEINFSDIVLDIGAGTGTITEELSGYAKQVIAYELDQKYSRELEEKFNNSSNIILKNENFLNIELPRKEFKIFSNIPFFITTDIINKITDVNSKLEEAFLFVQKESAERFAGEPKNTQIATILSFMYEIKIREKFQKKDFKPMPNVDIVLLNIRRKDFNKKDFQLYRDFITYIFNQMNYSVLDTFKKLFTYKQLKYINQYLNKNRYSKPTDIPLDYYLNIFQEFKLNGKNYINKVNGYYSKHLKQHSNREKVHRTRI
ncbi:MAG TPA: rRNA adenine N(6)-methyltransferase family protein [Candidatus Dojkabacteria bacterium]|nr:rRNA adenine N(6)-methyltransferase family protein [Candidatus Dojkabacteria bacterium]